MSADLLRLIHLAKLPPLQGLAGPTPPRLARCVMAAIVIHTDNGRRPQPIYELAAEIGVKRAAFEHCVWALVTAGIVEASVGGVQTALGCKPCKRVRVNPEALARIAGRALHEQRPVVPLDVAPGRFVLPELLKLRDDALRHVGVGVATVGCGQKGVGRAALFQRVQTRRAVILEMQRLASVRKIEICRAWIGRLLNLPNKTIDWTLDRAVAAVQSKEVA